MKMKKILALCLVLCLAAIAVIGGTLAYFTDTEYVENTMVSGRVEIAQKEWMRDGNTLKAYEDNQVLIPAVVYDAEGKLAPDAWTTWANDTNVSYQAAGAAQSTHAFNMPDADLIANVVDKIVTVENTGDNNAYVRTILVMACGTDAVLDNVTFQYDTTVIPDGYKEEFNRLNIDGKDYRVVVLTYKDILAPGAIQPSLLALWMDPDYNPALGDLDSLTVEVYSQAVQSDGFRESATAAETALDAAFGDVTAENLKNWLAVYRTP